MYKKTYLFILSLLVIGQFNLKGYSFPQLEEFVAKHSGKPVNCAMCHANDAGPTGNDLGQLGHMTVAEMARVNIARLAMQPGQKVDSPILNRFGNHIVETVGMQKLITLIAQPQDLATALGNKSDLDGDGIADSEEYLDGTDPLNRFNGDPLKLFKINLSRNLLVIGIITAALGLLVFGLAQVIQGFKIIETLETQAVKDKD